MKVKLIIILALILSSCSIKKQTSTKAIEIDKTVTETLSKEKKDNVYNNVISIDTTKTNFINIIINEKVTTTTDSLGKPITITEKQTIFNNEKKENHIYNQTNDSTINSTTAIKTTEKKDIKNENTVKTETTTKTKSFFWYYFITITIVVTVVTFLIYKKIK